MSNKVEQTVTTGSYLASGTSVFLGLNVEEWGILGAVVGILGVIATFAFNAWFKLKYHRGDKS
jgi:hypothetical protein